MIETAFTRLVGVSAPIQLAGMPGVTSNELVCAVANAGGLGMLGAAGAPFLTPDSLEKILQEIAANTSGVFGVNFLMPFLEQDCIAVAAANSSVVEFFRGSAILRRVGAIDVKALSSVTLIKPLEQ